MIYYTQYMSVMQTKEKNKKSNALPTILDLLKAGLYVASEVNDIERGVHSEELSTSAEGSRSDNSILGEILDSLILLADENIVGLLTLEIAMGVKGGAGSKKGNWKMCQI
jgi:hypothetical protein